MPGVTFDAVGTASDSSPTSPFDVSIGLTVGAGSNRALIVCVTFLAAITSPTAAWDQAGTPQAMTLIASQASLNGQTVCLFGLVNPTSGAKQIRLTWSGTASEVIVQAISWTNVNQSGGTSSFPNSTTLIGNSNSISLNTASGINNAGVAMFVCGSLFALSSVNNTQIYLVHGASTIEAGGCRVNGDDQIYFGATLAGIDQWAAVATDIKTVNPVISPALSNLTVNAGSDATFTISSTGTGTLHYQWKKNGSNVGTDSATYTLSGSSVSDNGATISCDVTDDVGTSSSNVVILTVNPASAVGWTHL